MILRKVLPKILLDLFERLKFRRLGIKRGRNCIVINSKIEKNTFLADGCSIANSEINMGTSIGRNTKVNDAILGKYNSISWDITIGAINHPIYHITTNAFPYKKYLGIALKDEDLKTKKKVIIENDVWIGTHAIILPGVKVGSGSIIGAGSVVTKDVEPYSIIAGVPAKFIKYRFEEKVRKELLTLNWWDLDRVILRENLKFFQKEITLEEIKKLKKSILNISNKAV